MGTFPTIDFIAPPNHCHVPLLSSSNSTTRNTSSPTLCSYFSTAKFIIAQQGSGDGKIVGAVVRRGGKRKGRYFVDE